MTSFASVFTNDRNVRPVNVPFALPGTGPFGLQAPPRPVALAAPEPVGAPDAVRRRALSMRHLRLYGIPVLDTLPCLPGRDEVVLREHGVVLHRMQALLLLAGLAQRQFDRAMFMNLVGYYGVVGAFDLDELAFLMDPSPSEAERERFCWGQEAVWTLLWAIHGVPDLGPPTGLCDIKRASTVVFDQSAAMLRFTTRVRPVDELLGEADRTYRYHWAVHDAVLHGEPVPGGLNRHVVRQRRMALEWLIGRGGASHHAGAGWIEVDLST